MPTRLARRVLLRARGQSLDHRGAAGRDADQSLDREKADLGKYQDEYNHKLRMLIDAKVEGREIVTPPGEDEPVVVNLMDALRASVAKATEGPRHEASGGQASQENGGQPSNAGGEEGKSS